MANISLRLDYTLAEITDKFNERFPETLRIVDIKQNPYQVFLKDTRSMLGYSSNYILPTSGKIPKLDLGEGVKYEDQYNGLVTTYGMENINFDMRITNRLALTPEEAANIGPEADLTQRIVKDSMLLSLKTANAFNTKVLTNNILSQMTQSNVDKIVKNDLTPAYVYEDINNKVDNLVANGFMPDEIAIVCTPDTIVAYNNGRRANPTIIFSSYEEGTLLTAAKVRMLSCKKDWMMSKYAFKNSTVDATKQEYLKTDDAVQVWYIIAPLEAIFWDIAETHSEILEIPNSPNLSGNFMERIGAIVRDERKDWVFAVTESTGA